jgi:hypothetical protein
LLFAPKMGTAGAALTQISSGDERRRMFPPAVWFSGHLLCFEHFLSSTPKNPRYPSVHNACLTEAVNI